MGIALVPAHGLQLDDLIAKADSAMYEVKDHGRHHFSIYREPESPAAFNSGAGP
ncbi:MAG TPA: diguanylate cyclase [Candidatus Kapabacteria bacterium]|nr:diguanylate cyclase [Candidatus Kapabacteria bacterium]